jgi:hypothetical protein
MDFQPLNMHIMEPGQAMVPQTHTCTGKTVVDRRGLFGKGRTSMISEMAVRPGADFFSGKRAAIQRMRLVSCGKKRTDAMYLLNPVPMRIPGITYPCSQDKVFPPNWQ